MTNYQLMGIFAAIGSSILCVSMSLAALMCNGSMLSKYHDEPMNIRVLSLFIVGFLPVSYCLIRIFRD